MFVAVQTWQTPVVFVDNGGISPPVIQGPTVFRPEVFVVEAAQTGAANIIERDGKIIAITDQGTEVKLVN